MNKLATAAVALALSFASIGTAAAKCYTFSDAPGVGVCVAKGSDSFDDRKRGKEILSKALGKDPGNVSSTSSSCSGRCFDADGNEHGSLSGY